VQRFKELDLSDPLVLKLQTGRAFDDVEADAMLDLSRLPTHSRILIIPDGGKVELRPDDVGIGISQVIPVIVTALDGKQRIASIEQPELHLHPRIQAELGDLFIESAFGDRQQTFILETHSEHLILRLLRRIRETTDGDLPTGKPPLKPDDIAVYYVQQRNDEGTEVRLLRIDDSGEFIDRWPDGFFEERAKELF
jgi:predicted ATPase